MIDSKIQDTLDESVVTLSEVALLFQKLSQIIDFDKQTTICKEIQNQYSKILEILRKASSISNCNMNLSKTNKEMVKINMYNPLINIQKDSEGSSNIKFEAPKIKNIKFEFSRRRSLSMRNRVIAKPCDIYGTKYEETNYKHEGTKLISYNETLNCMQNHLSVADSNSSVPDFKPKTLYSMIRYKKSDVRENMINIIKTQSINCQVGKHDSSDSETNATSARTPIPLGSKKNNINNKIDEDLEEETESPCILKPKFDYRAPVEVSKYPNCFNASKKAYNCMKMVRVPSTKRLRRHKFTM